MLMLTCKHSSTGPSSDTSLVHALKGLHYVLIIDAGLARLVELVSEDIEH